MKALMSKSSRIKKIILDRIVSGKYQPQAALPSEKEMAASFAVSHATVREAVSYLVAEGCLFKVQGKGTFIRNVPTPKGVKTINLYSFDTHGLREQDPFISDILRGIHRALSKEGDLPVRVVPLARPGAFAEVFRRNEAEYSSCGALFAAYAFGGDDLAVLADAGLAAASIGKLTDPSPIPFVDVDHDHGIRTAVKMLAGLGHRQIALLDQDKPYPHLRKRRDGFVRAVAELGLEGRFIALDSLGLEEAKAALAAALEPGNPCSALISVGDRPTVAAFRLFTDRGLRVPDDISIISYSDYNWVDDACGLSFTKIEQPVDRLAEDACKLLLGRSDRQEILQETFVVPGDSCSPRTRKE